MFWGSERFKQALQEVVPRGDPRRIEQGAYELSLGPEAFLSGETGKENLHATQQLAIPPGRIAVLLTEERISIPKNALGFISLKSRVKFPGLINVSGFHVDPGYTGRLIFTVYNAGTETAMFQRGDPMFLLWLAEISASDVYRKTGYDSVPSQITTRLTGAGASPPQIAARMARLEKSVRRLRAFGWYVGVPLVLALLLAIFTMWISGTLAIDVRIHGVDADVLQASGSRRRETTPSSDAPRHDAQNPDNKSGATSPSDEPATLPANHHSS